MCRLLYGHKYSTFHCPYFHFRFFCNLLKDQSFFFLQDVAVKVFSKMEYPEEVIGSFKQEVNLQLHLKGSVMNFVGPMTS